MWMANVCYIQPNSWKLGMHAPGHMELFALLVLWLQKLFFSISMGCIDVLLNCSWVSPLLSCCITFLRACLVYMTDPLRKLQAKATHICFCSGKRLPIFQRQKASILILPEKKNSKQRLLASLLSTFEWHREKKSHPNAFRRPPP